MTDIIEVSYEEIHLMGTKRKLDMKDMGTAMGDMLTKTGVFVSSKGIETTGEPLAIYHEYGPDKVEMEVGHPIAKKHDGNDEIRYSLIPKGKALKITHLGDYSSLHMTYNKIDEFMKANSIHKAGPPWEQYITDPRNEPDKTKWQTDVYQPIS